MADVEAAARRKAQSKGKVAPVISPIALNIVRRIDALFEIEREINGLAADQRLEVRHERSRPLVDALHAVMVEHRAMLSRSSDIAKAIDYLLKRWDAFTRFLADGRVCLSNNAADEPSVA